MRSIRGYILNLFDGLGPPPDTVQVNAKPVVDNTELNLTTHRLGALNLVHLPLSGNITRADTTGHFGWDMELAPGPINVRVNPQSPTPGEVRWRKPDETAQIGKGFISDIERLGWAGGKDHLIWDAVYDGHNPTAAQWSTDPAVSWSMGNGSISSFGAGVDAGRVTIRKFIAMLGGVPFSVEMGDLKLPVTGETARPANAGPGDRWDLLCATIDWNPTSATYGKQGFEFIQGTPGGPIPPMPANHTDQYRRLPLFALKMVSGTSVYGPTATDLRPWAPGAQPVGVGPTSIVKRYQVTATQTINGAGLFQSTLNTATVADECLLAPGVAYDGYAVWSGLIRGSAPQSDTASVNLMLLTEGRDTTAGPVVGGNQIPGPALASWPSIWKARFAQGEQNPFSVTHPIVRIASYGAGGRAWSRLRFVATFQIIGGSGSYDFQEQILAVHLWPVP